MKVKERNFFGKIVNFSVDRYRVIYLMIFLVTVMGLSSYIQLPKEIFPELKFPYAFVTVTYSGASPEDMEKLITTKIETAVSGVGDIKKVDSESSAGFSQTIIKFNSGINIYDKLRKIKGEVDHIKYELPKGIDEPIIGEYDVSKMPIMQLTLSGDISRDDLIDYSKILKDEIKKVSGISKVNVSGDDPRELVITIDPAKMSQYNISEEDVVASILDKNQDTPAGDKVLNDKTYTIRVKNSFKTTEEVEGIIVTQINNSPIFIKDIGRVDFEYEKDAAYAIVPVNFKQDNEELKRTIQLTVLKKKGVNLIEVCGNVRKAVDGLRDMQLIPENLEINYEKDMSYYVENSIKDVFGNAFSGLLVVIIVLFFFIDFKESLIIAFVIPMSLLMGMSLFSSFGVSINMITVVGLIISLGMLVDNAIVVVESIDATKGKHDNMFDTVKDATGIIATAIFSSTLTTVAAFVPLATLKGDMGELLKQIPIAVILTLSASFVVALLITPMVASRVLKLNEKNKHSKLRNWILVIFIGFISLYAFANNGKLTTLSYIFAPLFAFAIYYKLFMAKGSMHNSMIIKNYAKVISSILTSRKKRWGVLFISFCVFLSSVGLLGSNLIKKDNFPKSDETSLKVDITLSGSSTIEDTRNIVLKTHEALKTKKYIESYTATIDKHSASIFLKLPVRKKRELHSGQISVNLTKELQKIPNAKIKVTSGGDEGKAASLVVRLSGKDFNDLKIAQEILSSKVNKLSNVEYTWTSAEGGSPQLLVTFDHRKAEMIGLKTSQMGQLIRDSIQGRKITKIKVKDKELDVMLRNDSMSINSMEDLNKIHFTNSNGTKIPFMTVASLRESIGPSTILRKDNQKVIDIYIAANRGVSITELTEGVNTIFDETKDALPNGVEVKFAGDFEDMQESMRDLMNKLLIAVILIIMILVVQFDSFIQTFVVILAVPMAVVGVAYGYFIFNITFGVLSMLGVVSLAGIAVNDSIVLIDTINLYRKDEGMGMLESIIESGKSRFIPVLATSITTIAGVMPLAFYNEDYGQIAWTIIFGLIASTVLILVLVPIFIHQLELIFTKKTSQGVTK